MSSQPIQLRVGRQHRSEAIVRMEDTTLRVVGPAIIKPIIDDNHLTFVFTWRVQDLSQLATVLISVAQLIRHAMSLNKHLALSIRYAPRYGNSSDPKLILDKLRSWSKDLSERWITDTFKDSSSVIKVTIEPQLDLFTNEMAVEYFQMEGKSWQHFDLENERWGGVAAGIVHVDAPGSPRQSIAPTGFHFTRHPDNQRALDILSYIKGYHTTLPTPVYIHQHIQSLELMTKCWMLDRKPLEGVTCLLPHLDDAAIEIQPVPGRRHHVRYLVFKDGSRLLT